MSARSTRRCKSAAPPCSDRLAAPPAFPFSPRPSRHSLVSPPSPPLPPPPPVIPPVFHPILIRQPLPAVDIRRVDQRIKADEQRGCNGAGSVLHPFGGDGPAGVRGACRVFCSGAPIIEGTLVCALVLCFVSVLSFLFALHLEGGTSVAGVCQCPAVAYGVRVHSSAAPR